ncbi:autotransporter outer membrane beta-barrel domain-containing protein [Kineosporia babensis]|uniref:hypothetical protein n=1 Tax=Kineosporia babensis TaxID=499548 RepID=UPI0022B04987|nr:hypothetical protein [Kineosporia babensis]
MPYDPGSTIEDIINNVLGFALGAPGGAGSIDRTVTPAVVGQPGSAAWLVVTGQGEQPTVGYSTGQTAGKLTFWRRVDEERNQYIEIQLAGSPSIDNLDTGTPGSGNLVLTRDAWQAFHAQVPNLMGNGKVLDPVSIDETRKWFAQAAEYMGLKIDEMARTLENLDQDAESFRGSASETFVQRVTNAMAKVEGAREKARAWDRRFENSYHGARIFRDQVTRELTELGTRYEGALLNPINFVIKLMNSARVESVAAPEGTTPAQNVMITIPELGAAGGPFDVFNGASWSALDAAIRAKWATEVSQAFPDTMVASPQLVTDFGDGAAALRGQPTPGEVDINANDPGANSNLTIGGPGPGTDVPGDNAGPGANSGGGPGAGTQNLFLTEGDTGGGPGNETNNFTNDPGGPGGAGGNENNLRTADPNAGQTANVSTGGSENTFQAGGGGGGGLLGTDGGPGTGGDGGQGGEGAGAQARGVVPPVGAFGVANTANAANSDDGVGGGSVGGLGGSVGGMSLAQLQAAQNAGDLDQFLITDAMRDVLRDAGLSADGAVTLGELSLDQLAALQDAGLLDNLSIGAGGSADPGGSFAAESASRDDDGGAGVGGGFSDLQDDFSDGTGTFGTVQVGGGGGGFTGSSSLLGGTNPLGGDGFLVADSDLGTMSPAQLDQLLDSGALDDVAITDQMRTLLGASGAGADWSSSLGDLTLDQMLTLQDGGLLDGVTVAGDGGSDGSSLFSASTLDLTTTNDLGADIPQDLGDLSMGQLGDLSDSGLLDGIALSDAQLDELGVGGSGLEVLGDLNPAQLQDLQMSGLLDDIGLTPSQLNELGVDGLGSGTGGLGADLPASQFPTEVDSLQVGAGSGLGAGGGGGTSIGNISQSGATNLGSGSGFSVKAFEPGGAMAGAQHAGTLSVPSALASTGGGVGTGAIGSESTGTSRAGGMPPMMPMMPGGGANGQERKRNRNLQVIDVDDVWGADPDCAPAVIGRTGQLPGSVPEVPVRPEHDVDTSVGQVPGRARRPETGR